MIPNWDINILIDTCYFTIHEVTVKYHIYVQILLAILVLYIIFKKSDKSYGKLTTEAQKKAMEAWNPLPLVENCPKMLHTDIVDKKIGKYIFVNNIKCLHAGSFNFLGLLENKLAEELAVRAVKKYGIGSCGPRGFYGTVDVHLHLEEELARFMGVQDAIVYSYGFSTIASAIPAYAKRLDVIFADESVNFSIQKGLDASRSKVVYFEHNNVQHLEELLKEQALIDAKNKKKSRKVRKFLIVEGIYLKTGDVCVLPELLELKHKYKLRLFIDESISFGTLGRTGHGITEHFDIPIENVDLIMCSMENSLASIGGFCVGSTYIVEHQRLSGLGYCFSASLPPLLTVAAIINLKDINQNPFTVHKLQKNCEILDNCLNRSELITDNFIINGDSDSPLRHLVYKYEDADEVLDHIVLFCQQEGVALVKPEYLKEDKLPRDKSIRISIMSTFTTSDIKQIVNTIERAIKNI
ncbi:hypothetical protein O3M35_004299 [Rhynocoris fuscipes]|uniref:Serine palmitoyltransferase 1 n=1 Tax=Rhynocoris fuscipes TaxID=488301 RepID=A0AAW1CH31_9HEMI